MEFTKVILMKVYKTFGSWLLPVVDFSPILDVLLPEILTLDFFPTAGGGGGGCVYCIAKRNLGFWGKIYSPALFSSIRIFFCI